MVDFMKGHPLFRFSLLLILLAPVLWFLCRLTMREHPAPSSLPLTPTAASTPEGTQGTALKATLRATLLLHATPAPLHCSIHQQGTLLLSEKDSIAAGEYRAAVDLTKGTDLLVAVEWPNDELHTVRVEVLIHGYQATLEKSFWAERTLGDTLPVPASFLQ